jgi:hypothetical protein
MDAPRRGPSEVSWNTSENKACRRNAAGRPATRRYFHNAKSVVHFSLYFNEYSEADVSRPVP